MKKEKILKNSNKKFQLTHPDKILFTDAKVTKQDLADYYEKIGDKMLPYIKNRPLSVVRCPDPGNCFYQKHWTEGMPAAIGKVAVSPKDDYMSINTKSGIVALAQLAILEIHPWASRNDKLEFPDQIIFDLDPDVGLSWGTLIKAVLLVHKTLDSLNLKNFVKLTGGKGIHIVIPIQRTKPYPQIKKFTKLLTQKLAEHFPQIFTANMSKKKRGNKIFLDYLRNEREATAIAPFSPRKYPNAAVAVPISWKKLTSFKTSAAYTIPTIDKYFKDFPQDPWKDFFKTKQSITQQHFQVLQGLVLK